MVRIGLFATGAFLLVLNVAGFFMPLRNDAIYHERSNFPDDITLTVKEVGRCLTRGGEPDSLYILRVNAAVNRGIAHYWRDEGVKTYRLTVPITENYVLHALSYLYPGVYRKYEFYDYRKAVERGVGMCSQVSLIAAQVLNRNGVDARIVAMNGHVVATALVDRTRGQWWVLDPDYGIVITSSIREIQRDPAIAGERYRRSGYDGNTVTPMERIYGDSAATAIYDVVGYSGKKYYIERVSYVLIWLLPLALMAPYLIGRLRWFRGRRGNP